MGDTTVFSVTFANIGEPATVRLFRDEAARDAAIVVYALQHWIATRPADRGSWTMEKVTDDPEKFVSEDSDYEISITADTLTLEG